LERRLEELAPWAGVRVAIDWNETGKPEAKRAIAHFASSALRHRPDGKPEAGAHQVSVSHAGGLTLAVTRDGNALGCDVEPVAGRSPELWRDLLGPERYELARLIARVAPQSDDAAATRVWAAAESLKKAGVPHGAPLVLDTTAEDGWLLLRSGDLAIGTWVAPVRELGAEAAIAVLFDKSRPA
jgi:enediyne polyketide synthase